MASDPVFTDAPFNQIKSISLTAPEGDPVLTEFPLIFKEHHDGLGFAHDPSAIIATDAVVTEAGADAIKWAAKIQISKELFDSYEPFRDLIAQSFGFMTAEEAALRRLKRPVSTWTEKQSRAQRRRDWRQAKRNSIASKVAGYDVSDRDYDY